MGKDDDDFQEQLEKLKAEAPRDVVKCMILYCPGNQDDGSGPEIARPAPNPDQQKFQACGRGYKKKDIPEFLTDVL